MNRTNLNGITDLFGFLLMVGMACTGLILWWALPPGTNKDLVLWSLTRHQWGSIHAWISLGLLAVVLLHLSLHWKWISAMIMQRSNKDPTAPTRLAIRTAVIAILLAGAFLFAVFSSVRKTEDTCSALLTTVFGPTLAHAQEASNTESVARFLSDNCISCHNSEKPNTKIRFESTELLTQGEKPWIIPRNAEQSRLIQFLQDPPSNMKRRAKHLVDASELLMLSQWINQGASALRVEHSKGK